MKLADMHCDTISRLLQKRRAGERSSLRQNDMHLDLERMRSGGYFLQNFALFVNLGKCRDPWSEVCELYEVYREELGRNEELIAPVLHYEDILANEAAGRMSAVLTVEEGAVCRGELSKLRRLYEMGVRMLTLTWNYPNELGYPNRNCLQRSGDCFTPDTRGGLTDTGRAFVEEMEELGMVVDVSHLSDAGFYDVLEMSHKPFVASHSNARHICRHVRNLTDDMIRALAERGGLTGLNFCADFLREPVLGQSNPVTLGDVVRHARHIVHQGGVEVLGLGSDFDGIDTNEALPGVQSLGLLWEALHKAGFLESELDKIFSGNVLRVYRDTL